MVVSPALVIDAVRTPFGSHASKLASFHAVDLLASAFTKLVARNGLDPNAIDHVIAGCAVPVGEQAINIARSAVLAAGWSESVPAHTVDAQGASGTLALHEAVAYIKSGMARIVLVGAVASTRVPEGASTGVAVGKPFGPAVHDRFAAAGGLRSPGVVAEHFAESSGITREDLDAYAQTSIDRGRTSEENGSKKPYLLEIRDSKKIPTVISNDELPLQRDITKLKSLFEKDGLLTAATFATPATGAVAMIIANPDVLTKRIQPLGEIISCASLGVDVLTGSSGADVASLALGDISTAQLSHIEVQEDTAVTPIAFASALDVPLARVNCNGGALATGDPFGVAGLASVTHLLHAMAGNGDDLGSGLAVSAGTNAISTATVFKIHT